MTIIRYGAAAAAIAPPSLRGGAPGGEPTGTGCTCHLPTSDHPPSRSPLRERRRPQQQQQQHAAPPAVASSVAIADTCAPPSLPDHRGVQPSRAMHPAKRTTACVAAEYLPANCGTAPVDVADVLSGHRGEPDRGASPSPNSGVQGVLLSVDNAGRLVCADGHGRCPVAGCGCWILSVPLADDCHSYNCRLTLLAAGTVALRTTAPVPPGQPLKMWFPPDLQLMLHVPFLTPVNIKDERKYVCHECGYTCEKPNPLKIHLALDCGRSPRAKLWSRLAASTDGRDRTVAGASFCFSLRHTPPTVCPRTALSSAESAFRPYSPESSSASSGCLASPPGPLPTTTPAPPPPPPPPQSGRTPPSPAEQRLGDDVTFFDRRCAEMETIVSNLGHSEQGHLCIYCGKVYSRKYGLKIHIRTHTGFKPLKCKYCYRPFGDPSNLNKHVRLHAEGDTPYKCDCCGKILVRKRDLDRHMKSRHAQILPKSMFKMHVPV